MTWETTALVIAVTAPFVTAVLIFALGERRDAARSGVNLAGAALTVAAVVTAAGAAVAGAPDAYPTAGIALLDIGFGLRADLLGVLFAVIAGVLWLITTVYAIGYMSRASDRARFFGFFSVCVGSAIGIALSANLLTFFIFYETLTLATYPLVVHSGTPAALKGGRTYLTYALPAGGALAVGVVWLNLLTGPVEFAAGGSLDPALATTHPGSLVAIFALLMLGLGVKAALFPLHGWLPAAMVAPAPVSALLHAVAVVKAGVFGIARVVLEVYGPLGPELGVTQALAVVAGFTIIFGSVRALAQDDFKKRLAFSTVAQLSYITLGVALASPIAVAGGIAHLAHHAAMKITMFFTAGAVAEEVKAYRVSEFDGLGRRMPLTMAAFSLAAIGIVGVPPVAGFTSKWLLGIGSIDAGSGWVIAVLGISSVLNAAYFFPIIHRAWFRTPKPEWAHGPAAGRPEGDMRMIVPLVITAAIGLAMGVFAGMDLSPASWAQTIAGWEFPW
ncbi:MAG: monovalent cation/H+ antiporter subunit D family protein [Coriobacteriia bacterium]|nr:monovalent cation/H+ antiporter subunit D family protein [Coriobacteriia bacterium]